MKFSSEKHSGSEFPIPFSRSRQYQVEIIAYTIFGVACVFTPLLNRLHVESMAALSFVAFFISGLVAHTRFSRVLRIRSQLYRRVLLGRLVYLTLPICFLLVAMLWAPNCDIARGLLFVPLFPMVSVTLAVSISVFLAANRWSGKWIFGIGLFIAVAGPIYDLGFHPQFYTYNHVFGGILGPIYDEELAVRPGLFWFRGLSLIWAGLFVAGAAIRITQRPRERILAARIGIVLFILIGLAYLFSDRLGFNTPESYLKSTFSGRLETEHFEIFYDAATTTAAEVRLWEVEHEFRYNQLSDRLEEDVAGRIQSFIYPDVKTRSRLTGTRYTSVAPVWLSSPQVHVLASQVYDVFPHELVHVFSREFGMPIIRASPVVGLIEGFAVALDAPDGSVPVTDRVAASVFFDVADADDLVETLTGTLSPFGFWTGRGGVSYEISGAFVDWLIRSYGAGRFKSVYPTGDFDGVYGRSANSLAVEWAASLALLPVLDVSSAFSANRRFGIPSLFERECPHWTPPSVRELTRGREFLELGQAAEARSVIDGLVDDPIVGRQARVERERLSIAAGNLADVFALYGSVPEDSLSISERLILADAQAIANQTESAQSSLARLRRIFPLYARGSRAALEFRALAARDSLLMRVLVSVDSDSSKAEALETIMRSGDVRYQEFGLRMAMPFWLSRFYESLHEPARAYDNARAALRAIALFEGEPELSTETKRTLTFRTARLSFAAGELDAAKQLGQEALELANDAGDRAFTELIEDFLSKLDWFAASEYVLE